MQQNQNNSCNDRCKRIKMFALTIFRQYFTVYEYNSIKIRSLSKYHCKRLNFNFIAFEIDDGYNEYSASRKIHYQINYSWNK